MKKKNIIILLSLILILAVILIRFFIKNGSNQKVVIETVKASVGTILNTVTATGTIEPTERVEVGTQVSGVVQKIYVDYNSTVKKGQLIAELDKTLLKSQLNQSRVLLHAAQNDVTFQKKNYDRITALYEKGMVSQEDMDKALYSYQQAVTAEEKAKADLERARSNLGYASIYSPINGIILSRAVDEGQTVAASLNAPTLFTIARDLTKMEVRANVDEADIGQVQQGQRVTFTVDSYPQKTFDGRVSQVRLEPQVVSNVVTYTITIDAENPEQQLLPGMTASITIYTQEAQNVVTIPAKAIRFKPDWEMMRDYMKQQGISGEKRKSRGDGRGELSGGMNAQRPEMPKDQTRVWIKQEQRLRPVRIKTGLSDGSLIEVIEGLDEGAEVAVAMERKSKSITNGNDDSSQRNNPFMPRFHRRRKSDGKK
jgi:HlyD family secretion protein